MDPPEIMDGRFIPAMIEDSTTARQGELVCTSPLNRAVHAADECLIREIPLQKQPLRSPHGLGYAPARSPILFLGLTLWRVAPYYRGNIMQRRSMILDRG